MDKILPTQVRSTTMWNGLRVEDKLSILCPHCNDRGIFSLGVFSFDQDRETISSTGSCPSCNKPVYFWHVFGISEIYSLPKNEFAYKASSNLDHVPEPLARAFNSTLDSFNSKNFSATAVGARRTLEGIFKYLVAPEHRKEPLFKLIERVKNESDLAAPLNSLSHAIRSGGNLGAHFDDEKEVDEEMAKKLIELLDYLISYLHVLPNEIKELEEYLGHDTTAAS